MPDLELRERLAAYVADRCSIDDFENWLTSAIAEEASFAPAARRLAFDSMRLVSEYRNGDWTEIELRDRLGAMGRTYWFEQAPKVVYMDSLAGAIRRDRLSAAADRSRVVESA